ncbi:hypothetical protein [Pseudomonas sp.]|uniref:hypothetical protein n=1 Tax=Pseudomonas sp. TaxID=306 RepID=UPI003FD7CD00
MNSLQKLTDEEIQVVFHNRANTLSYYSAAEGECYRMESVKRGVAQADYKEVVNEMESRGMTVDKRSYLV